MTVDRDECRKTWCNDPKWNGLKGRGWKLLLR